MGCKGGCTDALGSRSVGIFDDERALWARLKRERGGVHVGVAHKDVCAATVKDPYACIGDGVGWWVWKKWWGSLAKKR